MILGDLGAEIVRIDRTGATWPDVPILARGKAPVTLDLKEPEDRAVAADAMRKADVLVEGFRPGVMERLRLGPDEALAANPRLIYARMTGWGQDGPLAQRAGHDINYIGLNGMLAMLAPPGERPTAPLNLLGDYGGGGLYLVVGILAALIERERSGLGQVVDAAIVDGSASMLAPIMGMVAAGLLPRAPQTGMLAGQAAYYRSYRCGDGGMIAVGALEPQFRRVMTDLLDLESGALDGEDASDRLTAIFLTAGRDHWIDLLGQADTCVSPILAIDEAARHPHLAARSTFVEIDGTLQPAVAPRLSRTPGCIQPGADGAARLAAWT